MQSEKKQLSKNRVKISVKVPFEKMEAIFETHYEKLAPTVSLPGFRPGKAPKVMTIEAIGQARLANFALEQAIDESYREALNQHKTFPVTAPAITITRHPSFEGSGEQNNLDFEVEFDILPEAKIGDYKKIKVDKADPKLSEVSAEEVDKVVEYLKRQSADLKQVDRAAKIGDWADIAFEGSLKNVVLEKLTSKTLPMVIGETKMIPGFEEKIVGMKAGENKEFELTFPKDFPDKELANKKVNFKVTLNDLREISLPKVDKEFLEKFGLKTEKELKTNIKKSLEQEKIEQSRQAQIAQISEQIIKMTKVEIPASLIENEKQRMKQTLSQDLSQKGQTLEGYMESVKITEKKMEEDLSEQAKRNILLGVGIGEIARKENIEINSTEGTKRVFDYLIDKNSK